GVLETRGKSTRILIEEAGYYVVGWVASKDLGFGAGKGFGTGYGVGRGVLRSPRYVTLFKCPRDLDLIARVEGEQVASARIGTIRAGTPFRKKIVAEERTTHGRVPIEFPTIRWLVLEKRVELTVESTLEDCKEEQVED